MGRKFAESTNLCGFLGLIAIFALISGCAVTYKPSGPVDVPSAKMTYEVAKEAEIASISTRLAPYAGWQNKTVWHFEISIKNPTTDPQRYRVRVVLPEQGVSGGGLLPLSGTPPVMAPGAEDKGTYPVNFEGTLTKVLIMVETVSFD